MASETQVLSCFAFWACLIICSSFFFEILPNFYRLQIEQKIQMKFYESNYTFKRYIKKKTITIIAIVFFHNTSGKDDGLVSCSFNRSSTVFIPCLDSRWQTSPLFDMCFKRHVSSLRDGVSCFSKMTKSRTCQWLRLTTYIIKIKLRITQPITILIIKFVDTKKNSLSPLASLTIKGLLIPSLMLIASFRFDCATLAPNLKRRVLIQLELSVISGLVI